MTHLLKEGKTRKSREAVSNITNKSMDLSSQKVQGEEVIFPSLELQSTNFSSDPENGHLASKIPKEFYLNERS